METLKPSPTERSLFAVLIISSVAIAPLIISIGGIAHESYV
jgi:hypothetical protein